MIEVNKWQTFDGQLFDTEREAEKYELVNTFCSALMEMPCAAIHLGSAHLKSSLEDAWDAGWRWAAPEKEE